MLRREAEQLQRQMEQMAKNNQQGQQGANGEQSSASSQQQQAGQQNSQHQSGASGQSGSSSSSGQSQQMSASAQSSGQTGAPSSRNRAGQSGAQGESSDQRIQEALSRMNQATEMMRRNSSQQQSAEDARAAAERLREAQNLLAGTQQRLATGKLDSMSRAAAGLTQEERAQSARIDKLANAGGQGNGNDSGSTDLDQMRARLKERDQLAADRQQLSDELSRLQKKMRDAEREMASSQPDVAKKLRGALTEMDESDLGNHVQRTADWLRRGINPNSNGTEGEIARGLSKLNDQLQQAQKTMAQAKPGEAKPGQRGAGQGDQTAALDQVERLRSELEAMARAQGSGNGQRDRNQNGQNSNGLGRNGQPSGRGGNSGGDNAARLNGGPGGNVPNDGRGDVHNAWSGDTRAGGGGWDGSVWGNYDTGNNTPRARGAQQPAPRDASGNPADTERTFDQELRQLRQLRQMVGDNPQAAKEVDELTRQMQHLDPSRFTGNPAMVEQMHREVLSSVDRLELELQHEDAATDARTGRPYTVPAGYQEAVAEYYRRLSKKQ